MRFGVRGTAENVLRETDAHALRHPRASLPDPHDLRDPSESPDGRAPLPSHTEEVVVPGIDHPLQMRDPKLVATPIADFISRQPLRQ